MFHSAIADDLGDKLATIRFTDGRAKAQKAGERTVPCLGWQISHYQKIMEITGVNIKRAGSQIDDPSLEDFFSFPNGASLVAEQPLRINWKESKLVCASWCTSAYQGSLCLQDLQRRRRPGEPKKKIQITKLDMRLKYQLLLPPITGKLFGIVSVSPRRKVWVLGSFDSTVPIRVKGTTPEGEEFAHFPVLNLAVQLYEPKPRGASLFRFSF